MKRDALFQLGMGQSNWKAAQTEDDSSARPVRVRGASRRACGEGQLLSMPAFMPPFNRPRGNSAKALITSA